MSIDLERPPLNIEDKSLADWLFKLYEILRARELPVETDASRGSAGNAGRVFFNSDDGNLNIDDGTNFILPDGTTT